MPATQFNMKWVEPAGLVKFDFLGLKTLTVIEKACALIAKRGISVDPSRLPLDDAKTFEMLSRGEAAGVFQLESSGMRDVLKKLKPDHFEDIIALVALYRPGPMDNIETYVKRKHGEETADYLYDSLEPVLSETYGVIIYQEQVMQIAQILVIVWVKPMFCGARWARKRPRRCVRSAAVSLKVRLSAESKKARPRLFSTSSTSLRATDLIKAMLPPMRWSRIKRPG